MSQAIKTGVDFYSTTARIMIEDQVKSWQQYCGSEKGKERRTHSGECQVAAVACLCHLSWGIWSCLTPPVLPVWDDTGSPSAWLANWLPACPSIHLTACLPPFLPSLPSLHSPGCLLVLHFCQHSLPVYLYPSPSQAAINIVLKILLHVFSTSFFH